MSNHITNVLHVGISVSDMERSLKWYKEVMGFEQVMKDNYIPPLGARIVFIRGWGGFEIELFQYDEPKAIPADRLIHLYIPRVEGKEKRKAAPSKEGYLGVEGIDADKLREMLAPFATDAPEVHRGGITKTDFYVYGLSGGEESRAKRAAVAAAFELPADMTANALLGALNILVSRDEFVEFCENNGATEP